MVYKVLIAKRALNEIDQSLEWLGKRSKSAAEKWYQRLLEAVRSLEDNPQRCQLAPESEWYEGQLR